MVEVVSCNKTQKIVELCIILDIFFGNLSKNSCNIFENNYYSVVFYFYFMVLCHQYISKKWSCFCCVVITRNSEVAFKKMMLILWSVKALTGINWWVYLINVHYIKGTAKYNAIIFFSFFTPLKVCPPSVCRAASDTA